MPWRDRECVKHSPHIGALISTAGKVSEVPPLSVSRAINQEPKTSWVAASPVHPRHRARTRRAPVFPRAPVLPFRLPPIQRINALWLPFTKDASRIPTAFRPDAPLGSDLPSETFTLSQDKSKKRMDT